MRSWDWAIDQFREGVPATWIAEEMGVSVDVVRYRARLAGIRGRRSGWASVWPQIRSRSDLLKLHREFAPRGVA